LEIVINLVNGLPEDARDTGTMEQEIVLASFGTVFRGPTVADLMKQLAKRLETEIQRLPPYLRNYIGPVREPPGLVTNAESQRRYNRLVFAREVLRLIAAQNTRAVEIARMMSKATKKGERKDSRRDEVAAVTRENMLVHWERLPMNAVRVIIGR